MIEQRKGLCLSSHRRYMETYRDGKKVDQWAYCDLGGVGESKREILYSNFFLQLASTAKKLVCVFLRACVCLVLLNFIMG